MLRIVWLIVGLVVVGFVVYEAAYFGWFAMEGENPLMGLTVLETPEIVFDLVTSGLAATAVGYLASRKLAVHQVWKWVVVLGSIAFTSLYVWIYTYGFGGHPNRDGIQIPVAVASALLMRGIASRFREPAVVPNRKPG